MRILKAFFIVMVLFLVVFQNALFSIEKEVNQASAYFEQGVDYYSSGDYEQALSYLTAAIQADNTLIDAYYYRARVYMEYYKDYDKAIADFNKIVSMDQTDFESYYLLGACYFNKGDKNNAQASYNNAINTYISLLNQNTSQPANDITNQVKQRLPYYDVLSIYYMDLLWNLGLL
ncbi:MAG: tetratricopeptide repeat protein [Deferribacterota bacterium]|nr:tetratricopeptide repeat protein [Deferribacterota bacterium]